MGIPAKVYRTNENLPQIVLRKYTKNLDVHGMRCQLQENFGFSEAEAGLGKLVKNAEKNASFVGAMMVPTKENTEISEAFKTARKAV